MHQEQLFVDILLKLSKHVKLFLQDVQMLKLS